MELCDFQKEGIEFLTNNSHSVRFLFDDMGLGKTVQACVAAEKLGLPILVVCPKSPVSVWSQHIKQLTSKVPYLIQKPSEFRWPLKNEAVIGTYAQLSWLTYQAKTTKKRIATPAAKQLITNLAKGPGYPVVLIFDEAHALKGFSSRAIQGRNIAEACRANRGVVWALTGTPLPCSPLDLWGLLSALGQEQFVFKSFEHFLSHFGGKEIRWESIVQETRSLASKYGYRLEQLQPYLKMLTSSIPVLQVSYETHLDISFIQAWRTLHQQLKQRSGGQKGKRFIWNPKPPGGSVLPLFQGTAMRRLREKVLPQLQPISHRIFQIPVSDIPKLSCKKMNEATKFLEQRTGLSIEKITVDQIDVLLKDVVAQEHLFSALRLLAEVKIPFLQQIVLEHEEAFALNNKASSPLAICSEYRKPIEFLAKRECWQTILGGQSTQHRAIVEQELNSRQIYGVGYTSAGEEGLTLTACYRLVKVSSSLSPSREIQREARLQRYGQTRGVIVDHLIVDHPLDTFALKISATKSTIAKEVLDT